MPKVTVYIRNEDIEQWRSLGAKTTFIHNALKMLKQDDLSGLGLVVDDRTQVVEILPENVRKTNFTDDWNGAIPKSFSARKKK